MKTTHAPLYALRQKSKNLSKKFHVESMSEDTIDYEYLEKRKRASEKQPWWHALNEHLKAVLQKDHKRNCKPQELF